MMLTTAAFILIVTSKVVLGQDGRWAVKGQRYSLDMAENSVDDRYDGCSKQMKKLVKEKFQKKEIAANISGFGTAWNIGLYKEFNKDVRTGRAKYQDKTFSWYSLHFWLTRAIQTLKKNECMLTYRRTWDTINGVKNKEIRFGSFASSSIHKNVIKTFGNKSCFEIRTCYGANVTEYSRYPNQNEVLIPPYETFNITNIKNDWCETVFELNSTGIKSNLNCSLASVKPMKYHNVIISD